eukprot:365651-Chlamydomonas_euryale.AAC.10
MSADAPQSMQLCVQRRARMCENSSHVLLLLQMQLAAQRMNIYLRARKCECASCVLLLFVIQLAFLDAQSSICTRTRRHTRMIVLESVHMPQVGQDLAAIYAAALTD